MSFSSFRAGLRRWKRPGEVYGVHVQPDFHRHGYGTALLSRAREIFRDRGYREEILWVVEGNTSARQFYDNRRFTQDPGVRKVTDWLGVPEVRYRRRL